MARMNSARIEDRFYSSASEIEQFENAKNSNSKYAQDVMELVLKLNTIRKRSRTSNMQSGILLLTEHSCTTICDMESLKNIDVLPYAVAFLNLEDKIAKNFNDKMKEKGGFISTSELVKLTLLSACEELVKEREENGGIAQP